MATLGKNIKMYRKERKMTQDELAEKLNVAKGTLSTWERDDKRPSYQKLEKLCEVLNVSMNNLVEEIKESYSSIFDEPVWVEAQPSPKELEKFARDIAKLDHYGLEAINSILKVELYRCEVQGTLRSVDDYTINIKKTPVED